MRANPTFQRAAAPGDGTKRARILIVEDSALIALALEDMCVGLGWDMLGPARSVAEGLQLAQSGQFDAALLDVSLHGELSWDIASVLVLRSIPFVFATGHDIASRLPAQFAGVPVVRKPFRIADVERPLRMLLADAWPDDAGRCGGDQAGAAGKRMA